MATLQMGEYVSNVSHGIDTFSIREPLGVCAGICPFNFPAMIPLWVSLLPPFFFGYGISFCISVILFISEKD
jgi:acyl-CoA reductase-like NAD-dependent aldehyde dehydrogenase